KEPRAKIQEDLEREGVSRAAALYEVVSEKRDTADALRMLDSLSLESGAVEELRAVADAIRKFGVPDAAFAVDLGVVRGLDYYTGTIYETTLLQYPELGSICSGGRYDDLASHFSDTRLPGVGISIGLTRLFSKLREAGLLKPPARTPAQALVVTMDGRFLDRYIEIGRGLREAGVNTEVYLEPAKLKNQLAYADRKGFHVAVIAGEDEFARNVAQVKDLSTKTAREHPLEGLVAAIKETLNGA
ncbi:MAG TPA: HisS family protein, partial [Burkholderiales bacterium]|nr:HisS family protein [Burkholderiales bacterium]